MRCIGVELDDIVLKTNSGKNTAIGSAVIANMDRVADTKKPSTVTSSAVIKIPPGT
jgi:hypothetical protein